MKTGLQPATREAMDLLMRTSIAFAHMSRTGIRVDETRLDKSIVKVKKDIAEKEEKLRQTKEMRIWMRQYGDGANLESSKQLGQVVFKHLKYKRNPNIRKKNEEDDDYSNNARAFEHLDVPFINDYFEIRRLKKALKTNLYGLKREAIDGVIHAFWSMHIAESYRSSNSLPNMQNAPVRNEDISEIIRSCIIPREGHLFLEFDLNMHEVRVAQCYNQDPALLKYIMGGGDMHRDRCKELYKLTDAELGLTEGKNPGKYVRYCAKNKFVFPEFYGSYYAQCAPDLWEAIKQLNLRTAQGVGLYEHLRLKGINRLGACDPAEEPKKGTFEFHVKQVERNMWDNVFTVYDQWRRDWWSLYQAQGGINTKTGFRMYGVFRRNQILCDPIQGSAFHCLAWALIGIQNEFLRRKMRSRIVNQVHDSILVDAHQKERDDVIEICKRWMVKLVMEHWRWITVPLAVEVEIAEENWFAKRPFSEN